MVFMTDLQTVLTWLKSAHGILFVFTPSEDDHFCKIQRELLGDCEFMLRKHGLILAEIFEQGAGHIGIIQVDAESCDYFRRQFRVDPGQFKVLLISKDQHIKLTSDSFVSERELAMRLEVEAVMETEAAI
jgi:hypothetical protein